MIVPPRPEFVVVGGRKPPSAVARASVYWNDMGCSLLISLPETPPILDSAGIKFVPVVIPPKFSSATVPSWQLRQSFELALGFVIVNPPWESKVGDEYNVYAATAVDWWFHSGADGSLLALCTV